MRMAYVCVCMSVDICDRFFGPTEDGGNGH